MRAVIITSGTEGRRHTATYSGVGSTPTTKRSWCTATSASKSDRAAVPTSNQTRVVPAGMWSVGSSFISLRGRTTWKLVTRGMESANASRWWQCHPHSFGRSEERPWLIDALLHRHIRPLPDRRTEAESHKLRRPRSPMLRAELTLILVTKESGPALPAISAALYANFTQGWAIRLGRSSGRCTGTPAAQSGAPRCGTRRHTQVTALPRRASSHLICARSSQLRGQIDAMCVVLTALPFASTHSQAHFAVPKRQVAGGPLCAALRRRPGAGGAFTRGGLRRRWLPAPLVGRARLRRACSACLWRPSCGVGRVEEQIRRAKGRGGLAAHGGPLLGRVPLARLRRTQAQLSRVA